MVSPCSQRTTRCLGFDDVQILTDYFQLWKELIDAGAAPNPDEYEQIATLGNDASPVITGDAAFHQSWNNFGTIGANAGNDTLELLVPPVKKAGEKALWYKPGMFFSVSRDFQGQGCCCRFHQLVPEQRRSQRHHAGRARHSLRKQLP